jgi:hypothetical protein
VEYPAGKRTGAIPETPERTLRSLGVLQIKVCTLKTENDVNCTVISFSLSREGKSYSKSYVGNRQISQVAAFFVERFNLSYLMLVYF